MTGPVYRYPNADGFSPPVVNEEEEEPLDSPFSFVIDYEIIRTEFLEAFDGAMNDSDFNKAYELTLKYRIDLKNRISFKNRIHDLFKHPLSWNQFERIRRIADMDSIFNPDEAHPLLIVALCHFKTDNKSHAYIVLRRLDNPLEDIRVAAIQCKDNGNYLLANLLGELGLFYLNWSKCYSSDRRV